MDPALLPVLLLAAQAGVAQLPAPAPPPAAAPVPQPPPQTDWPFRFSDDDYPAAAIRNDEQGVVRYRVEIGADGRASGCTITSSSGSSVLDSTTCRIVSRRARFLPATDSQGHPVPDTREGEVIWRLEEED